MFFLHRQNFGAKFNLTYHNGARVADILKTPGACSTLRISGNQDWKRMGTWLVSSRIIKQNMEKANLFQFHQRKKSNAYKETFSRFN